MRCPNCASLNTQLSNDASDDPGTYDCLDCGIWFHRTESLSFDSEKGGK